MVLGQAAAMAASMAIDKAFSVQEVDVSELQQLLVKDPFLDGTPPDVLADDADSTAVETQGGWEHVERFEIPQPYKGTYFISKEKSEKGQWLRFKANIKKPGSYGVYLFHPIVLGWKKPYSPNTTFSIKANGEIAQKSIDFSHLRIN